MHSAVCSSVSALKSQLTVRLFFSDKLIYLCYALVALARDPHTLFLCPLTCLNTMSLEPISKQCTVGPDGRLKEPWEIELWHDPDDPHPLPLLQTCDHRWSVIQLHHGTVSIFPMMSNIAIYSDIIITYLTYLSTHYILTIYDPKAFPLYLHYLPDPLILFFPI
jgi:hypothetical protein